VPGRSIGFLTSTIENNRLAEYVGRQVQAFYPDNYTVNMADLAHCTNTALDRVRYCFEHINDKYYFDKDGKVIFNHLNGDHYATFLYFLSNTVWLDSNDEVLASKIFLLNKALHGIDVFYEVSMPDIFTLIHPLGTVLGRASYSDFMVVYQGCTIGSVVGRGFPTIGKNLTMYSNSSLLGNCIVGDNVIVGAGSYVINSEISNNKIVVGQHPNFREIEIENHEDIFFK